MERTAGVSDLGSRVLQAPTLDAALHVAARAVAERCGSARISIDTGGRSLFAAFGGETSNERTIALSYAGLDVQVVAPSNEALDDLAAIVALALHARVLSESARIDALTGVANRATLEQRLQGRFIGAIAMMDIDHFKAYNDREGHPQGDAVLRRVAHAASASLQGSNDVFARYGGEEFVALIEGADAQEAASVAERMREAVRALGIPHAGGKSGRVTLSVGFAVARDGETAHETLARADAELYRAKLAGRDRVCGEQYTGACRARTGGKPYVALVGMEETLSEIVTALTSSCVVTVCGPAGSGKTRLAFAAACRLAARYNDVALIDAAMPLDARDVLRRIESLEHHSMAVLDGCEHLTEAARDITAAASSRAVTLLVTSRVPLDLEHERVVRVNELDGASAFELFARAARTSGALLHESEIALALVRRLGRLPGQLIAASVRLAVTTPAQLLEEVALRGPLAAERSTLQSITVDAFNALNEETAAAMACASVFVQPFTCNDAAHVLAGRSDEANATRFLDDLREFGLLAQDRSRWICLKALRDAAAGEPATRTHVRHAEQRHLAWCLNRFKHFEGRNGRVENQAFVEWIAPIAPEVEAALARALAHREMTEHGMALCAEAARFWFATSRFTEAYRWCEAFLDTARGDDFARLRLFTALARTAYAQGRIPQMERYAREGLALAGEDPLRRGPLLNYLGIAAKTRLDAQAAASYFREYATCSRAAGNKRGEAIGIASLGSVAMDLDVDFPTAKRYFSEGIAFFRESGDELNAMTIESNLVEVLACCGEADAACEIGARLVHEARAFGNVATLLLVLSTYFAALEARGDVAAMQSCVEEVLALTPQLELLQFHTVYDMAARLFLARGDHWNAALLFHAAQWAQIREGQQILPIERYHHRRALEAMNLSPEAQAKASATARSLADHELQNLLAALRES